MKVALVLHGFPPELVGGTENSVQALARALVAAGHDVVVIAGSMEWEGGARTSTAADLDPLSGREYTVHRIHRSDAYFDHWQKGHSPVAGRMFEELLAAERPDVVHVQHWIRLSRDLAVRAARLGIPSVVTLNDLWSTCLVAFRVHPAERAFCERPLAPENCLDCAAYVPPRTPWLDHAEQAAEVEAHRAAVAAELRAARVLVAPSGVHARAALGWLGLGDAGLEERVVVLPPAREPAATRCAPKAVPSRFTADEPLVLASFGQWSELKGTDLLIEALGLLPEPARVRLLLAGGAPFPAFAARVEELAAACPVDVRLLGAYDHSNLAAHPVADAHLFVTGTRAHESWGLVVDEALELGLGTLLPELGALGERAHDAAAAGTPWATTYQSASAPDLARALQALLEAPAQVAALSAAAARAVATAEPAGRARPVAELAAAHLAVYERAVEEGPASVAPADPEGEAARAAWVEAWDQNLSTHTPEELGLA